MEKFFRIIMFLTLAVWMTACAKGQPAIALPTPTGTAVLPTATLLALIVPTEIFTPIPTPTAAATATATATATSTFTATPSPTATATKIPSPTPTLPPFMLTSETPPLPLGKGGLIINNHYGVEMGFDLGGKLYKIPPYSRMIIFLAPGKYTFTGSAVGYASKAGATEILDGYYRNEDWG